MFSLYYGIRLCLLFIYQQVAEIYQQVAETMPHLNRLDCGFVCYLVG